MTRDIIPFPNPDDSNPLNVPINTPQPIHVKLDGDYFELVKQDVVICRISWSDVDTLYSAARMLSGMCKAGIIFGELEEMRDIVSEFLREANRS